jgi:serine/threonine protein kinase
MSEGEAHLPERSVQILLIDFNLMSSSAKRLKEMYFKVTSVSSSAEAQEAIAQATFKAEIILVDLDSVNMSDPTSTMSCGLALLQDLALKSKNIPIIGLSSIDDRDLRRKIISAGAREVLSLPIHKASRDTLLKYGRLYHHLNKPQRSKSFHMIPSVAIEKGPEDSKDEDTNQGTVLNSTVGTEDAAERTTQDEEPEGGLTSAILPSSLVGNTSCYSHATSGTERMDTPNTTTDAKAQVWSAQTAAKRVVSEGQQKHSAVGTIHFMAPEVIFEHKYGRSVDWWACGVTFYECTVRQHLFSGLEKEVIMQQILSGPIDLEPLSQHSSLLQNLVAGMLVRNPNLRLGTEGGHTIMRQDFFRGIDWNTISESVPNYKPAQHVNQRHSLEDKMLFYGEVQEKKPEHNRRVDSSLEDYRRAALAKEGRGAPGASASRSKKRHCKNLNMRQRKEDFQKLTDKRKSWVSGNHLLSEINGGKKVAPFNAAYQGKQTSQRGSLYNNPSAPGTGIGRSGIMNASLDWSITMLPEGDSEEGKVDDEEEDDEEHKQSDSKEVQDLDDSVSACASADYEAHPSDDEQEGSESPVDPTVMAADEECDSPPEGDGGGESECDSPPEGDGGGESECDSPPEGDGGGESECDSPPDSPLEGYGEGEGDVEIEGETLPAEGTDSQAYDERNTALL